MLERLDQYCSLHAAQTFLTFNLEFVETLCYSMGIEKSKIWFVTECLEKAAIARCHPRYSGINVIYADYLTWNNNMKFDVIAGNPPYQTKSDADDRKTQPLWHKFVAKSFELLKEGGYLCMVHPSGWRNVAGMYENTKDLLLSKDIRHIEMYDKEQGIKTFGARTMYDWYVLQNLPAPADRVTTIRSQDGKVSHVNLSRFPFVPSGMFEEIQSLIAKDGEEKVEVLYARSAYGHDKKHISRIKDKTYRYPVIYTIRVNDEPVCHYSNTNQNGHFGIPKFIWASGGYNMGSVLDIHGDFGTTEWASSIVDTPENLPLIKKAFDSEKFRNLMRYCDGGDSNINRKVIALFRKDFWKHFVDESGNEIK